MIAQELFSGHSRRWLFFGRDPQRPDSLIDTNQYVVQVEGRNLLLDPGGMEVFPEVVASMSKYLEMSSIDGIFASHQDPDVISSLSLWLNLKPDAVVYASWVWGKFIPHFGGGKELTAIPDQGMPIPLGSSRDLQAVPAHYLHSSGNFNLYDPVAKILFSGDLGAALLPEDHAPVFVKDFDAHTQYMEGFHKRWMPSNRAKNDWVDRISRMDIEYLCPQHGAIFPRHHIGRFLQWLRDLQVGSAVA
ncbi:MAG TPA: MBL fold metallo-hydrolase [bacterium]